MYLTRRVSRPDWSWRSTRSLTRSSRHRRPSLSARPRSIWRAEADCQNQGMSHLKDAIGQPISVGDLIAYGHALGRCAGVRIGKVLSINPPKKDMYTTLPDTITVWGIDHEWLSEAPALC